MDTAARTAKSISLRLPPAFDTAQLRGIRRAISRELRATEPRFILDVARELIESNGAPRWIVYELLSSDRRVMAIISPRDVRAFGLGINSWGDVDSFACFLAGPAWREQRLTDTHLQQWARSKDRWWRRAALVSTVALNNSARGGSGDTTRTLLICEMLLHDRDDMVVKAMSWALRELAKKDAAAVRSFVRVNESELAARVLREVHNKLATGLKNPKVSSSSAPPSPTPGHPRRAPRSLPRGRPRA